MTNDNAIILNEYINYENTIDDLPSSCIGELFLKFFSASSEIKLISDLLDIEVVAVVKSPYGKRSKFFKEHTSHRFETLVVSGALSRIQNPKKRSSLITSLDGRLLIDIPIYINNDCAAYILMGMFYLSDNSIEGGGIPAPIVPARQVKTAVVNICQYCYDIIDECFRFLRNETDNNGYDAKMLFNYGSFYDYNMLSDTFLLSKKTAEIFGWELKDQYTYSDFVDAIVEDDKQRVVLFMRNRIFLSKGGDYMLMTSIKRKSDKQIRHIEITGSIIKDEKGFNIRTMGYINDITALKDMQEKLKDEVDSKNRLIRIVGHDLKNPFNGLIGFSELLANNIETGNYKEAIEFAQIINQSASQGYDLLVNLLDYSNSQAKNLKADYSDFDLYDIVDSIVRLCTAQALKKGITLHNGIPRKTIIQSDEYKVNTVLRNLISNAIKFCYKDGAVLVEATYENEENIRISVSDAGVGIPEDKLLLINKCKDVDSTRGTAQEKGTSIGLKMCHSFLNVLGSRLFASCDDGITTFYFDLRIKNNEQ